MCHGQYNTNKTIKRNYNNAKHANAKPYDRAKTKKDFREYED
jgi:hypothetical protein